MVAASGVLHAIAITLLIVIPHTFLHRPPALKSYTVDLIAPDRLGGTNMIAGGKGRVPGPPMAAAPKVEAPAPPPPKVEPPKPPEPKAEPPKPPPPQPEAPKPEPPKPEPQKVEPPKPPPPEEVAKREPVKPEPKPREEEAVLAKKVVPPAAKPAPVPSAKPAAPPKAVAKAEAPKPQPKVESKAAAEAAKAAEKAAKDAAAAHARDEKIEAAIKRMQQQVGKRGAGTGTTPGEPPGGPISVGPGEGAGGTVKGVEYLLYYNQMINRIKQVWAWAGANRTLEAAVRFNITENGDVVNVRISRPSGDPSYDASVERAVRAANPLPPPPEAYRKEFSDVELIFRPEDLTG